MSDSDIQVKATFGPAVQDRSTLSTIHRRTLEAFFRHPIAHNIDRIDVISLFKTLGKLDHGENTAITYTIGHEHIHINKSHGHSLLVDEVMALRHLLIRAGWGPGKANAATAQDAKPLTGDWLVLLEAGEAKLFHLDVHATDKADHTIHPNDPHRLMRHLAHGEQGRDEQKRNMEEQRFFEEIAKQLVPGGEIVLIGHGAGHSNVAQMFSKYLHAHHHLMFDRIVNTVVADIPRLSDSQLLELARTTLTV